MTPEHYIIYTLVLMNFVGWAAILLTLRKWHGKIFERVYYDLPPTTEAQRNEYQAAIDGTTPIPGSAYRGDIIDIEQPSRSFAGRI